jgi:transposase InsO family protein
MRLMKEMGLTSMVRVKKYNSYRGDATETAPHVLERNVTASAPNQKWVTDITEFSLFGEKLYLSTILDLYARDLVSYNIGDRPVLSLVMDTVTPALAKLPTEANPIIHSDQGWHYRHKKYRAALAGRKIVQSMSRKGNCLDNAVMENFFGTLKSELLYLHKFNSLEHFKHELLDYLSYYNNLRVSEKLNGLTPLEFRFLSPRAA